MPEYPDITIYIERLHHFVLNRQLLKVRLKNPFILRTADPPVEFVEGLRIKLIERVGKRIVFGFGNELFLVVHLMISGRLHWHRESGRKFGGKLDMAAMDFSDGTLLITEASSKKRAALHIMSGRKALNALDRGGIEVFEASTEEFAKALQAENHTLKRALTDPRILSGIGNAYSDEILHRARLSPIMLTRNLSADQIAQLHFAVLNTLQDWTGRLREETGDGFPEKVTAFRKGMSVHGRYGKPCPDCGSKVQRIRYSSNETNYCPKCQTDGRLLADRSLSRLLRKDWPRTPEELEESRGD